MDLIRTHIPLHKEDSINRKNLLSEIKYFIFLNFSEIKSNLYEGHVTIELYLKEVSDIFLDYEGITDHIIINDKPDSFHKELNRIYINKKSLKIGLNKLDIKFKSYLITSTHNNIKLFSNSNEEKVNKSFLLLLRLSTNLSPHIEFSLVSTSQI